MIRFGVFELDAEGLELRKRGVRVKLQDQPLRVLQLLLERPGQVVTRDDLRARVWPGDTFVEFDQGLYSAVARLRAVLGDSSESPIFVETVARRGYRFIAPCSEGSASEDDTGQAPAPRHEKRLRGLAVGGASVAGPALLFAALWGSDVGEIREWLPQRTFVPVRSMAVFPLANLSGDPDQDYFAEGVTDQLTASLAGLGDLRVISSTSVQRFKADGKSVSQLGRELNLDAVIEGTVARMGSRVRVSLQVTRLPAGRRLWAQTYDGELKDVALLQSEAVHDIARAIQLGLTSRQQQRLAATRRVEPEAYEACLKGFYFSNKRSPWHFERAIEHFQRAIERDPGYALAYAGLSEALVGQLYTGTPLEKVRARATEAALKAVEIDPSSPEGHCSLAGIHELFEWDWPGAEREFRSALELNPNYAGAHQEYAVFLGFQGRFDQSISEAQRAQDLDPVSPFVRTTFCLMLATARRYESALEKCRQALELDPDFLHAHDNLVVIYAALGMGEDAVAEYEKAMAAFGASPARIAAVKQGFGRGGMEGFWREVLRLELSQPAESVSAFEVAQLYSRLGDTNRSLTWLERAFAERSIRLEELKVAPELDGLRSDPRFVDLLHRLNF